MTSRSNIIAIDPGATGAVACRTPRGTLSVISIGSGVINVYASIKTFAYTSYKNTYIIEDVGYHRHGNNAQASATFARNVGHVEMAVHTLWDGDDEIFKVKPKEWQAALGPLPKDKAERKRKIRDMMQAEFPALKVTLSNADALGILYWAMRSGM